MGASEKQQTGSVMTLLTAEEVRLIVSEAVREALASQRDRDGYLDTVQAAEYLGTTTASIRTAVARGNLKPDHRGQRGGGLKGNRFTRATLDAFCKRASE
jgi:hypothetical protein